MSFLKDLSQKEVDLITSLPYRVGHWISSVDDLEKTKRDDKLEKSALNRAIRKIAHQNVEGSFPREIMAQLEQNSHLWQGWGNACDESALFADIGIAKELIKSKLSQKELKQYKQVLWYMALVVAQAFSEDDDPDQEMHVNHLFSDLKKIFFPNSLAKSPENMSNKEKTALKKLRATLKN